MWIEQPVSLILGTNHTIPHLSVNNVKVFFLLFFAFVILSVSFQFTYNVSKVLTGFASNNNNNEKKLIRKDNRQHIHTLWAVCTAHHNSRTPRDLRDPYRLRVISYQPTNWLYGDFKIFNFSSDELNACVCVCARYRGLYICTNAMREILIKRYENWLEIVNWGDSDYTTGT